LDSTSLGKSSSSDPFANLIENLVAPRARNREIPDVLIAARIRAVDCFLFKQIESIQLGHHLRSPIALSFFSARSRRPSATAAEPATKSAAARMRLQGSCAYRCNRTTLPQVPAHVANVPRGFPVTSTERLHADCVEALCRGNGAAQEAASPSTRGRAGVCFAPERTCTNVAADKTDALLSPEAIMSKFHEKAEALTKQIIGQMVRDDELVREGKEQQQKAELETRPDSDHRDRSSEGQRPDNTPTTTSCPNKHP
jgi:hypothetical protein